MRGAFLAMLASTACACSHDLPLAGQVLLVVDTDALLPPPVDRVATHAVLFDALAIDVFPPGADQPCAGCSRQFTLDEGVVNAGNASVGIPEASGVSGYRARVRLYHTTSPGAGPHPDSTIESVVALPSVGDTGEIAITVFLATDNVANPSGTLDAPIAPVLGSVTSGHAGSWPGGASMPCRGAPNDGEVCVPGGAFWMGNAATSYAGGLGVATDQQRIVVISPFFLDAFETTVGDFRGHSISGVVPWTGANAGVNPADWCSYSSNTTRDPLPLNCITWAAALSYCTSKDPPSNMKTLPTEAQLEYAEGAMRSSLYVWGEDDPSCGDAVFGLTGYGASWGSGDSECRPPLAFGGPLAPGRDHTGSRDVLVVGNSSIYDLAGNVAEWPLDSYEPQGGDCWATGVLHDPVCTTGTLRLIRGGSWVTPPENLRASARVPRGSGPGAPDVGVRCARPDEGP